MAEKDAEQAWEAEDGEVREDIAAAIASGDLNRLTKAAGKAADLDDQRPPKRGGGPSTGRGGGRG
jgi:hypothetical protein